MDLKLVISKRRLVYKAGSKWQTMENRCLLYGLQLSWIRAYAPEISMGMQTAEEVQDVQTYDADFVVVDQKFQRK